MVTRMATDAWASADPANCWRWPERFAARLGRAAAAAARSLRNCGTFSFCFQVGFLYYPIPSNHYPSCVQTCSLASHGELALFIGQQCCVYCLKRFRY